MNNEAELRVEDLKMTGIGCCICMTWSEVWILEMGVAREILLGNHSLLRKRMKFLDFSFYLGYVSWG